MGQPITVVEKPSRIPGVVRFETDEEIKHRLSNGLDDIGLPTYHLFHAARADLLSRLDRPAEAVVALDRRTRAPRWSVSPGATGSLVAASNRAVVVADGQGGVTVLDPPKLRNYIY